MLEATVLEDVPHDAAVYAEEAFGPVVVLERFSAMHAWDELEVGGVILGDVPSFRVDNMPYGGVKGSGAGREGVRWAMADMTEERLLVMRSA